MVQLILTFLTLTMLMLLGLRIVMHLLGIPRGTVMSFFTELAAEIAHDILQALWSIAFGPPRRRIVRDRRRRARASGGTPELYYVYSTMMSLGNQGVFQFLKEVTFRGILGFYNSRKWGHFWAVLLAVQCAWEAGGSGPLEIFT